VAYCQSFITAERDEYTPDTPAPPVLARGGDGQVSGSSGQGLGLMSDVLNRIPVVEGEFNAKSRSLVRLPAVTICVDTL
jgi:hypothetical protein